MSLSLCACKSNLIVLISRPTCITKIIVVWCCLTSLTLKFGAKLRDHQHFWVGTVYIHVWGFPYFKFCKAARLRVELHVYAEQLCLLGPKIWIEPAFIVNRVTNCDANEPVPSVSRVIKRDGFSACLDK